MEKRRCTIKVPLRNLHFDDTRIFQLTNPECGI